MKKIFTLVIASALSLTVLAQGSSDKNWSNKAGRFGIGVDPVLGGSSLATSGLLSQNSSAGLFGIQAVLCYNITSGTQAFAFGGAVQETESFDWGANNEFQRRVAGPVFGLGVEQQIFQSPSTRFHLDAVLFGAMQSATVTETADNVSVKTEDLSKIALTIGIKPSYHFTSFFGLHTEVGFIFALVNRSEATYTSRIIPQQEESKVVTTEALPVSADLLGSFGFTVWFN